MKFSKKISFDLSRHQIDKNANIVFLSDFFFDNFQGGAEMTTEALYQYCNSLCTVQKLKISELTKEDIILGTNKKWVIFNTRGFLYDFEPLRILIDSIENLYIVDYDYRYCKYRNPTRHFLSERTFCECSNTTEYGQLIDRLYDRAKAIFFMSTEQRRIFKTNFPNSVGKKNRDDLIVLSSILGHDIIDKILSIDISNKTRDSVAYLETPSWVKGTSNCKRWIEDRNRNILIPISNMSYADTLAALAKAETLCYLPAGEDTCPRLCIEARLLGCNLETNNFVQNRTELWFQSKESILEYYKNSNREEMFFKKIMQ